MKKLQKQAGFTLIELVIVIVILGILAATAAPKFIDLTGDAKESVMRGVQGSLNSAIDLAHSKALVTAQTAATGEFSIGTVFYALEDGYPSAAGAGDADGTTTNGFGVAELLELDTEITGTAASPAIFQHSAASVPANCQLSYANAADNNTRPVITVTLSSAGCT
ncbi:type II secretion system protein [Colwellia sp. BRX9-1]|jgi:MSHA pilin protein MshA|uniref:type II secretion system protein n=1 Tax=Colwellia sp. BRX9-1 TaxID=2759830 RepID=UPI0015F434EA|nr:type II secretion system protein [Colwellia sp. BRX9-1]MBA6352303.1 type II secretion system protein [Colwellia sp. BRX9-1]